MKLASMQLTEKEAKAYTEPMPAGDAPRYPYGLCLYLDSETLKKLGVDDLPAVGQKLTIIASAEVVSVGMSQQRDGDKESRAELQITEMSLQGDKPPAAEKLYGGSK